MVRTAGAMVDAGARISVLVLRSDDLAGALGSWTPKGYALKTKERGAKTVLDLERRGARPDAAAAAARVRIAVAEIPDSPNHYCAVSDCRSAELRGVFMAFISRHSPEISRLFLTNEDMAAVLGCIESQGYDVSIRYGSTRGREQTAGAPESETKSTTASVAAYFGRLSRESRAAMTVRYSAEPNSAGGEGAGAKLRGSIARDCRFSAGAGAGVIFDTVIPRALSLPLERNRRMEESAASAGSGDVEPTVIRFGSKIFRDAGRNGQYVDMIAKMPDSSISKYCVSPHIHLSLVDYMDGSSYGIWVVTSDRLVIVPQIKATGPSLKRLVNHIFECMGEGRVERYEH